MRGHLQQRGGDSWRIKVYVGRSGDDRKRCIERTIRGARREAERELARLVVEVDEGRHAAAAPMTYGELLDRWLTVKAQSVEPKTLESYEWVARKYLRPALADRKLASVSAIDGVASPSTSSTPRSPLRRGGHRRSSVIGPTGNATSERAEVPIAQRSGAR